jgi:hypothetical protein
MEKRGSKVQNLKNADRTIRHLTRLWRLVASNICCLAGLLLPVLASAGSVGDVTHLDGVLHATSANGVNKMLSVKSEINEGDTLQTAENTYARIKFVDGGEVVLRPETVFKVEAYSFRPVSEHQDNIVLRLIKGGLRSVTGLLGKRSPDNFKMKTETATIGIRGTHFGALLCNNDCAHIPTVSGGPPANGLHTDTASGSTIISNAAGSIVVHAGAFSFTPGSTVPPRLVPPSQGIQVTMPPVISSNRGSGQGMGAGGSNSCTVN